MGAGSTVTARARRASDRVDNPLVRTVGRIPATVRTKLLVAFVGTIVLLVIVGLLGIRVLGQSNDRVERLGALQERVSAYRGLQTQAGQLRLLVGLGARSRDASVYASGDPSATPGGHSLVSIDTQTASTLAQFGQAANGPHLGFTPPRGDQGSIEKMRAEIAQMSDLMTQIIGFDQSGTSLKAQHAPRAQTVKLAERLQRSTGGLVSDTQAQTDALIAQNGSSFTASQRLFIAVAVGSILLALLLGFVLSWALIGPIRKMETGLEAIAAGDFSSHVNIENRDELGSLGANIDRMNDELGRLYAELETVSRHKSEFLANMSHELRTPLNAIIGFSEVLHEKMFGDLNDQQLGYVDDVLDAGRHLLSLINDILDLAKVEAGRMELELSDVSLPQVLQSGLTMCGDRAARGGITLGLSVTPDDIVIRADERKLRQVVFNLLSNAVKFTPAGGHVDVAARLTGDVVEVDVADTGSGIAQEDQEVIFEEVQQARGDPTARQEGTGLGLPLSRRFLELHGGRLWVESAPGHGSTFRFTVPVEQPA